MTNRNKNVTVQYTLRLLEFHITNQENLGCK
jgi:hypothetical protein